jgi:hypothetical protein
MDTKRSPEVWDRLSNESGRAYEAFKVYMHLPPAERTVTAAWRRWTENPEAVRPSPFFEGWAREYAWPERARTHDHHLELIRRRGMEKAIEAEAAEQARQAERQRNRLNEMMALGYAQAMEYLEELEPSTMRFSDVAQVIRLHMDAILKLDSRDDRVREADWTEEDDAEFADIIEEIDELEDSEEDSSEDQEPDDPEERFKEPE